MTLCPEDRETISLCDDSCDTASIYTFDKRLIKKLDSLCRKCPDEVWLDATNGFGARTYTIPKRCVSIREPVSMERREAASRRALEGGFKPPDRSTHPKME